MKIITTKERLQLLIDIIDACHGKLLTVIGNKNGYEVWFEDHDEAKFDIAWRSVLKGDKNDTARNDYQSP